MAVVPAAERAQDATEEIEMDDLAEPNCKERLMCLNTDNCVLRRTYSAPSGELRENEHNFQVINVSSSAENSMVTQSVMSSGNCKTNDIYSLQQTPRTRTYSADSQTTQMTLNVDCNSSAASPVSIGSPARRIMQIRREESVDELTREVAKERDVTSAINLSRSLDETSWLGEKHYMITHEPQDKPDSIDVLMTPCIPSIPSPVRFIDKIQHNRSLTPSPIGVPVSPKQRTYRRSSISPSNLRPSLLSSKRKLDPDDRDSFSCSPAKRNSMFYSPTNTFSSISSNSSPDRISDTSSNQFSCDDDSGSDHGFTPSTTPNHGFTTSTTSNHGFAPSSTQSTNPPTVSPINTLLSCDTRSTQSFAFNKLQYVAPQSPLAAGGGSGALNHENKRKLLGCTSYTFTPVKE